MLRSMAGQIREEIGSGSPETAVKPLEAALQTAVVEQRGAALQGTVHVPGEVTLLAHALPALMRASGQVRAAPVRVRSVNNLRQLAIAMHGYHDTYQSFPAAAIYSKDGKPLLSWRVALLPFIEQDNLYKQFNLDEPWDSAHNKALLKQMPATYDAGATAVGKTYTTFYQVFAGKGSVFDGKKGRRIADITDGTSNTIMIAEAAEPVPWTKPEDLPFDPKKPLPKLGGLFADGFNVAMCDASVHFLKKTIKEDTLRALITRSGGEVIGDLDQ